MLKSSTVILERIFIKGISKKSFVKVVKNEKSDDGEAWYTSGTHEWKGKIPYLIIKLRIMTTNKKLIE